MADPARRQRGGKPVGILVIDDSPIFLHAVRDVIAASSGLKLVGEAGTGEEGVAMAMRVQPDLVLVDVLLPGIDGLETCRRLHSLHPAPLIVLCSVEEDPRDMSPELPCADAPFLDKRALSSSALLRMWQQREETGATTKIA